MNKVIVFLLLYIACAGVRAVAQNAADSAKIYFRLGHSRFEPEVADNALVMQRFLGEVRRQAVLGNIDRLVICSYTSPNGVSTANLALSSSRSRAVAAYVVAETGVDYALIDTLPGGIGWEELRRMIAADNRVPFRREALHILDHTPVWVFDAHHNIVGSRKKSLMDLEGGDTYRWLQYHIFPKLHNAVLLLYVKDKNVGATNNTQLPKKELPYAGKEIPSDVAVLSADTLPPQSPLPADTLMPCEEMPAESFPVIVDEKIRPRCFALKTNILYAAILMPSLEMEWRVGRYWSVNLEGEMAWWKKRQRHKCYQVAIVSPEARLWFRGKSMQRGLYAGAFVGAGLYDWENGKRGYRGEGVMAGITFGYMWPFSQTFSIEAGIGGGWLSTRYKEYVPYEDHHIYLRSRNTNYIGPLKLKCTLVWRLGNIMWQ